MSVDTPETEAETDETADTGTVEKLGRQLGDAITDLETYRVFEEKSEAVEADDDLQAKMDAFEEKRRELMLARQTGEATHEDMAELKELQQDLHSTPTMAEFLRAQEALVEDLELVNEAISEPLAVDFGEEAGGCCQDD